MKLMAAPALFSSTIALRSTALTLCVLGRRLFPCQAFLCTRSNGRTKARSNRFSNVPVARHLIRLSRIEENQNQNQFLYRLSSSIAEDSTIVHDNIENNDKNLHPKGTSPDVDAIANILRNAYNIGETDQVQDAIVANSIFPSLFSSTDHRSIGDVGCRLIDAAIKAATEGGARLNRGALSGILNAILASCCSCHRIRQSEPPNDELDLSYDTITVKYPELAWAILQQMDEMHSTDENAMVSPDLVSLSLVYYVLHHRQDDDSSQSVDFYSDAQSLILDKARRLAKKSAGSQRRKALAAERRRKPLIRSADICGENTIMHLQKELQSIYGPNIFVLHHDDDVLVVSKPAGMVCYHNKKTGAGKLTSSRKKNSRATIATGDDKSIDNDSYGTKALDISLEDALLDVSIPLSTLNPSARGIVHRLDRGTSGVIVLAKNDDAHLRLVALFFLRRVKKTYLALIPGRSLDDDRTVAFEGVIDSPVDGRPAISKYRVVRTYGDPSRAEQDTEPTAILLEVETLTGRKHQVRVHCANGLRRPIFLDPLYSVNGKDPSANVKEGKNSRKEKSKNKGVSDLSNGDETIPCAIHRVTGVKEQFFLHAQTLSISEMGLHVESPLPLWWDDVFNHWEETFRQ
ncbi:hypothetical protein ACHAW6_015378 [Cyclotella cf. meneghiniana]